MKFIKHFSSLSWLVYNIYVQNTSIIVEMLVWKYTYTVEQDRISHGYYKVIACI